MLAKEGISQRPSLYLEQLSEVKYTRPTKFEEKYCGVQAGKGSDHVFPTLFFGSFYQPENG